MWGIRSGCNSKASGIILDSDKAQNILKFILTLQIETGRKYGQILFVSLLDGRMSRCIMLIILGNMSIQKPLGS